MASAFSTFVVRLQLANSTEQSRRNLYRAIATDIHFWIPFSVLLGGIFLLDKLR
jgi:hypothetical protein